MTPELKKGDVVPVARFRVALQRWCAKGDLNPHSLSATSTSNLRVYHSAIRAHMKDIPPAGSVKGSRVLLSACLPRHPKA